MAATSFAAQTYFAKGISQAGSHKPSNTQLNILLHGTPEAWAQAKFRLFPYTSNPDHHASHKYYYDVQTRKLTEGHATNS